MTSYIIPKSLIDLKQILIHNGYTLEAKRHLAKFYYIIHKLKIETIFNKAYKTGKYVQLHSRILESLLGEHYSTQILTILSHLGIIDINHSYQTGVNSKGYRLKSIYLLEPYQWIDDDSKFSIKLDRYKALQIDKHINSNQYHHIFYNLKSIRLNYDLTNNFLKDSINKIYKIINNKYINTKYHTILCPANESSINIEILTNLYNETYNVLKALTEFQQLESILNNKPLTFTDVTDTIINKVGNELAKLNASIISIQNILRFNNQNKYEGVHFVIDNKGNRLHNNITNLCKELRTCLIFEDTNKLSNVDISCSQPLILALQAKQILGNDFYNSPSAIKYLNICLNDDIYIYLMNKSGYTGSRKEFKSEFYSNILFGKTYKNELSEIFKNEFIDIWKVVLKLKENSYKHLSISLQLLESNLMYNGIVTELLIRKPDLFFLTIHDSILCKTEDCLLVAQTMKDVIRQYYNINPKINIEDYN